VCCLLQDFHVLAQRCSAAATLHFFHSMNWVRDVKGACHADLLAGKHAALEAGDVQAAQQAHEVKVLQSCTAASSAPLC
jgi:hypothetical protein